MTRVACCAVALVLAGIASAAGPPPGERPVVVRGCEGLYFDRAGRPDVIVVSDLPLEHSAYTAMHQMTQAIKLTLKDRGFRAGTKTVGYVVCDDSGPAGTFSAKRCAANAGAAARARRVVAVIGTLDTSCARIALRTLAPSGIVLVSPLNTGVDLTRPRVGRVVRLSAPDDAQAAAAVRFLRDRGVRRAVALSDGTRRGDEYRAAFERAARAAELRVVDRRAGAAYVGGVLSRSTPALLTRAAAQARGGPVVAAAGLGPAAQLASVGGETAEGVFLTVSGLPVDELPAAGRRFALHFETALGKEPHAYAVYAAQAARIVLDAVASSNGTRGAVGRAVLRTRFANGLVGSLAFDANGDPVSAPVAIYRVHNGGSELVRVIDSAVP